MPMLDLQTTIVFCATLLVLAVLLFLIWLIRMLLKQSQLSLEQSLTYSRLLTQENQSLRNQLLTKDPYSLHAMNEATNVSQSDETSPSEDNEYEVGSISDDLSASGWAVPQFQQFGGTPVVIEE